MTTSLEVELKKSRSRSSTYFNKISEQKNTHDKLNRDNVMHVYFMSDKFSTP